VEQVDCRVQVSATRIGFAELQNTPHEFAPQSLAGVKGQGMFAVGEKGAAIAAQSAEQSFRTIAAEQFDLKIPSIDPAAVGIEQQFFTVHAYRLLAAQDAAEPEDGGIQRLTRRPTLQVRP